MKSIVNSFRYHQLKNVSSWWVFTYIKMNVLYWYVYHLILQIRWKYLFKNYKNSLIQQFTSWKQFPSMKWSVANEVINKIGIHSDSDEWKDVVHWYLLSYLYTPIQWTSLYVRKLTLLIIDRINCALSIDERINSLQIPFTSGLFKRCGYL